MDIGSILLGILAFVVLLSVIIIIHELGHLITAKKFGVYCHEFSIGRAHLQRIFREHTGLGAIEYFCQMRISAAKQLIRENKMNLTDTAKTLGYTSIHYFSKQFKKITGIPPSRYQESIRSAGNDPIYQQIELEQKKEWGE